MSRLDTHMAGVTSQGGRDPAWPACNRGAPRTATRRLRQCWRNAHVLGHAAHTHTPTHTCARPPPTHAHTRQRCIQPGRGFRGLSGRMAESGRHDAIDPPPPSLPPLKHAHILFRLLRPPHSLPPIATFTHTPHRHRHLHPLTSRHLAWACAT